MVDQRDSSSIRRAPTFPRDTRLAFLCTWRILSLYPNWTASGLSDLLPRCLWWPKYSYRQSCMNRSLSTYFTPLSKRNFVHSMRLCTDICNHSNVWVEINIRPIWSFVNSSALELISSFQLKKYWRNVSVNHTKRRSSHFSYGANSLFCFLSCSWTDLTLQQWKKSFISWQKLAVSSTSSIGILLLNASAIDLERICTANLTLILA